MNISLSLKKYFHSQFELVDIRKKENRDINSLSTYLTQVHSMADKLRENYGIILSKYPEFKVLRAIRNYMHHVDDVEELRMYANPQPNVSSYHVEHLIIPMNYWAKCLRNLINENTLPEHHPQYKNKKKFLKRELEGILDICDCTEIIKNLDLFCSPAYLKCDGKIIELGFDIYKFIYNTSNIIVHEFRNNNILIQELRLIDIDDSYTIENNIPKHDISSPLGMNCILTLDGYIFPKEIQRII